jgi:hypothetical protein
MVESESSDDRLLTQFCEEHTTPDIKIVAEGYTSETFDPRWAVENATDPVLLRERVRWYTTCIVMGQLN